MLPKEYCVDPTKGGIFACSEQPVNPPPPTTPIPPYEEYVT